jgi:hypothetical protein
VAIALDAPASFRLEEIMRAAVLVLAAIGTLSAIDVTPAAAGGYPYCMRTRYDSDDCSYPSYQACALTASGQGTTCFANPALAYGRRPQAYPYADGGYVDGYVDAPVRHYRRRQYDY